MMTLHMVLFVEQFNLVEEKELTVLNDLIGALKEFKGKLIQVIIYHRRILNISFENLLNILAQQFLVKSIQL